MKLNTLNRTLFVVAFALPLFACKSVVELPSLPIKGIDNISTNNLTIGQVSLVLKKNETTQTEVVEKFGAPNLVTSNSNNEEVWTYQKHATISQVNNMAAGTSLTVAIYNDAKSNNNGVMETSTKSLILIVKFKEIDGKKLVTDFSSRYSSF
jgi:hypothetical protein